jgi:hypothetical protein
MLKGRQHEAKMPSETMSDDISEVLMPLSYYTEFFVHS